MMQKFHVHPPDASMIQGQSWIFIFSPMFTLCNKPQQSILGIYLQRLPPSDLFPIATLIYFPPASYSRF